MPRGLLEEEYAMLGMPSEPSLEDSELINRLKQAAMQPATAVDSWDFTVFQPDLHIVVQNRSNCSFMFDDRQSSVLVWGSRFAKLSAAGWLSHPAEQNPHAAGMIPQPFSHSQ